MTDGQITEGLGATTVANLVNDRATHLADNFGRSARVPTFSFGYQADHLVAKRIACSANGIWTPVKIAQAT